MEANPKVCLWQIELTKGVATIVDRVTQKNNTSGYSGVDFAKREGKWRARIKLFGKEKHLGFFDDKEMAIEAKKQAEITHFGDFRYKPELRSCP